MGVGRPIGNDGFADSQWTPELLPAAISEISVNQSGVDLRTVQRWFQDNDHGISASNIHWLARIFGCDDPEASGQWQIALSAAQARLMAERRNRRKIDNLSEMSSNKDNTRSKRRLSLAMRSEALFSHSSPLDLPASVFAGSAVLGFLSYLIGVHNVTYERFDGLIKQVGFIWAPNWTLLFMLFMPLFFAFVVELLGFWKKEGRLKLIADGGDDWTLTVESSSYTYWVVLLFCLPFAGVFQWISVRLIPLIKGGAVIAPDWGTLVVARSEAISVPELITFSGLAYIYMSLCFYFFFVGLILLYTVAHDFWRIGGMSNHQPYVNNQRLVHEISFRIIRGVFRCTILGIMISLCMKLQTFYLSSNGENIVGWLLSDMFSVFKTTEAVHDKVNYSMPTHYSSLLIALTTCVVFLYGSVRLGFGSSFHNSWTKMATVVVLLVICYLMVGVFVGWTILLTVGVLIGIYGLFDPGFGRKLGDNQIVL
jgi:hypothetical protein